MRTHLHAKLKLYEFKQLMEACEEFGGLADGAGVKQAQALRAAIHGQCKAFLDHMHQR